MARTSDNPNPPDPCDQLRSVLLDAGPESLERLAGRALGSLLGVTVRIARSGDQRGGDGGVSGTGGRDLVFEARRYRSGTRLDERSIQGQILQAAGNKPDLEAWILVTTREVPAQIQDAMEKTALSLGIGAIAIDWFPDPLPRLAVLAASSPEVFATEYGQQHKSLLNRISQLPGYVATLESMRKELQSWAIGYGAVRDASHKNLREIWQSSRRARAGFRQDVAGGDPDAQHLRRSGLVDDLDRWLETSDNGAIGALVGTEGTGKTWAALDWLQYRLDRLPIVVLAPSSALGTLSANAARVALVNFIARCLHEVSGVRDVSWWEQRVRRLLSRPADEGPSFLLYFDGLNQNPSIDWQGIFHQLEDDPFHARVRTLVSTRTTFLEERLGGLRRLTAPPCRIAVGNYDLAPGGEFERKLALSGLSRDDLPENLVSHAVVPRMFDLMVRLRSALGGVREVTVHRLLWAYAADAIPDSSSGSFTEKDWRRFLLQLAGDFTTGVNRSTLESVEAMTQSPTRSRDEIHRRISGIVDGIHSRLEEDGDLQFDPDFVHHALGLALVSRLAKPGHGKQPAQVLDEFLDPIAGYDGQAETLRAAVTIALLRNPAAPPAWLGGLCTRWLHSQNLPATHLADLETLAPELVMPLLDVIETSSGHSLTTPRQVAVAALERVDRKDPGIASIIAQRGSAWQSRISRNLRDGTGSGALSSHSQRCDRLKERIGRAEAGPVSIAGRRFEIVDRCSDDLPVAAAQLLQDRPLKGAIEFLLRGAIHTAIVGGGTAQETQSWLNALNTVDPEDTAAGLRSASEEMRLLAPQPGHHPDLNARIASILLWRTGHSEDAVEAKRTDPGIDSPLLYETDYLRNPSRSLFPLERRHASQALCDTGISLYHRIERAKDALLDPTFDVPRDFAGELASASRAVDFRRLSIGRSRTAEDLAWEHMCLALARCDPQLLADLERARLRQYAERPADQRLGSALGASGSMLLAGPEEVAALKALRERDGRKTEEHECAIRNDLLIAEILHAQPVDQITRIMDSGLDFPYPDLFRCCNPPSSSELDHLLDLHGGDEQTLGRLASSLPERGLTLSRRAFDAFSGLLHSNSGSRASAAAWILLASNDAERLGAQLDLSGWSWSPNRPKLENDMGSVAIAASNRPSEFADLAGRIAPSKLLAALPQGSRTPQDVRVAVDLLTAALFGYRGDVPESGLDILHDCRAAASPSYWYTVGDIADGRSEDSDVHSFVERINHPERHERRRQEIMQSYFEAVAEARRSGAQLLHSHFVADDFDPVLEHFPGAPDAWLEGMDPPTGDFRRRVRLADGFYVALCEALLKRDPSRGIALWRSLRQCLTATFADAAGIDRLKYAPFCAEHCPEVDAVLEELYALQETRTDKDLFDVLVAARRTGRVAWLRRMISRDRTSPCPLHRERAAFLCPLVERPDIAGDAAWPSGDSEGGHRQIREHSWIMGQREAFAAHWLRKFAEADTAEAAHASWLLFMAAGDCRAMGWMSAEYDRHARRQDSLDSAKMRFLERQQHRLDHAMNQNQRTLAQSFATRRICGSLRPWNGH